MQHDGSSNWEERSKRISVLRFPLIVGVVFIHAYVVGEPAVPSAPQDVGAWISRYVRDIVSQGIARTAVPIFFLMAGYLFYRNFRLTPAIYFSKLRSRVETLLIPFLFWNLFAYLFFAVAQSLPQTSKYFTGSVVKISELGLEGSLAAILGIGREPISYQFWFVRDLMVAIVLAPVLFPALRRIPKITMIAFLLLWVSFHANASAEGVFFFVLGAAAAVHDVDLFVLDRYGKVFSICYVPLLLADVTLWNAGNAYLHTITLSVGVVAVLYASRFVAAHEAVAGHLIRLAGASFFVFAAHEPLLTVCRKIFAKVLPPPGPIIGLVYYVAIPALIIFALVRLCGALRRSAPQFARVIGAGAGGG